MTSRETLVIGAGFLGTALASQLASRGQRVHLLSRRPEPPHAAGLQFHRGSLDDLDLVRGFLKTCRTIYHTACTTTPGSSAHNPVLEGMENLLPTLTLLQALQDSPDTHLVFLSSGGCLYGDLSGTPADERHCPRPVSYHGAGKAALEAFLHAYAHSQPSAARVTVLRPSNLYGPGQSLRSGFGLVRTVLERLRTNQPIDVWGDGETVRDYLYIEDLIEACTVVDRHEHDRRYRVYNVSAGMGHSINQLITTAERVCGRTAEVRRQLARSVDIKHVVLDSSALRRDTGWFPAVTLEDGLRRTWQWLLEQNTA